MFTADSGYMEAVVSYQLLRRQVFLPPSLPPSQVYPLSLFAPPLSVFSLSLSLSTFPSTRGRTKVYAGPFILSHSERWLQCIMGNGIQLCFGLCLCVCVCVCVCVCWCRHMQECVCVCVCLCVFFHGPLPRVPGAC